MISDIWLKQEDSNLISNSSSDGSPSDVSLSSQFVFYIFLILDIPSVVCSLLLFYFFLCTPELREQRHSNEMIIYLLVGTFLVTAVDIPLILPYLQNDYYVASMKNPKLFCIFWIMYDYVMYFFNLWLTALVCFERYLFIFFKGLVMKIRKQRFFLYYVPLLIIFLLDFFWYLYLIVLYPCEQTQFDFTQIICGSACYRIVGSGTLLNIDWIVAALLPIFLTILFTFILIGHVLYQRQKISRHLMRQNTWRRTRKMFLQLLPITFIYLLFNLPSIIVGLLSISNPWYTTTPYFYVNSLSYCLALFMPFAVLFKQTAIHRRIFTFFRLERLNRIDPLTTTALPMHLMNNQRRN